MHRLPREAGGTPPQIALGDRGARKGQCAKAKQAAQTGKNVVTGYP
jgi:hypothetical protein